MIMKLLSLMTLFIIHGTSAVIYKLNASDHSRMPPIYHLDEYERCIIKPEAVYCYVELDLVVDEPTELYTMITEYSEHTTTHLNHTKLQYGICVMNTCKKFVKENTTDLTLTLEACLNESLWNNYGLKSAVVKSSCHKYGETKIPYDSGDIVVAVVILVLITFNVIGSFYGFFCKKNKKDKNKYLLCFSLLDNARKLFSPPTRALPLSRLRGLNGLRTITLMLVVLGHGFLPTALTVKNELYFEQLYDKMWSHIFFNGTFIIQTFFLISGFLVVFKFLMYSEHNQITWSVLPKGIISRWLRLTPTYALVLAITSTWIRFAGTGPMWSRAVDMEVEDCRRQWWYHLLYINNYIDNSQCLPQTWYLAGDMQLHILGLIVLVCFTSSRARKVALGVLIFIGLITPAIHTYVQNLHAVLIVSPGFITDFFISEPTFNNVYKRGHTNLINFSLGMATGWLVYNFQGKKLDDEKYKKHRYLMWSLLPIMVGIILMGRMFYMDGPQPPVYLRAIYAMLVKPCFGICLLLLIVGMIFKVEDLYRGILEWSGWTTLARLSYCTYLVHVFPIRTISGMRTTLTHMTFLQVACDGFGIICLTLLLAIPVWLLVENPIAEAISLLTSRHSITKDAVRRSINLEKSQESKKEVDGKAEQKS